MIFTTLVVDYVSEKATFESGLQQAIRHCLVVRIPGSHPGGPGSIPGVGKKHFPEEHF